MENKLECICNKYRYGRPHPVSRSTWYQHIQEAGSEEERQKFDFIKKLPPGARHAATIRALAKRAQENSDSSCVGWQKRAKPGSADVDIDYNFDDNNLIDNYDHSHKPSPPPEPFPPPEPSPPEPSPSPEPLPLRDIQFERRRRPDIDVEALAQSVILPKIKEAMEFVLSLRRASLTDLLAQICEDALDAYNHICRSTLRNFAGAEGADEILSFHAVERLISQRTGVEAIEHDMCSQSCLTFTGPFTDLKNCPMCGTHRWDQAKLHASNGCVKVASQKFATIPLGPQLQGLYCHPDSACNMRYLHECTQEVLAELRRSGTIPIIDDIIIGWDYLGAVLDGDIKQNDIVLMVSLDGGFIPGPNKPKNLNSFLIVSMHHLAALQNEGLTVWDTSHNTCFISDLHLLFTTADGPGLVYWDGMVGHSGKNGCRMYCGVTGRRKTQGTHYYPALLNPRDRCAAGSDHADINIFRIPLGGSDEYTENLHHLVASPTQRQWEIRKTQTGLTKPPLILGLNLSHCLSIPHCMMIDIMHLARNLSDVLIGLWCGTIDCDGDVWAAHGVAVEKAGPYLPGSFDRRPRNIAEKLNTSYKTWEFQLYTFGLRPALLYGILPELYWVNYCKLVRGFQLPCQHRITANDLTHAHTLLCTWEHDFEVIYYALKEDSNTFTHTIGNLGQEIHQPSNPYANLSKEGLRRCQVNTLLSVIPELDKAPKGLSNGAVDIKDGYALLRKCDRYATYPVGDHAVAFAIFFGNGQVVPRIRQWAWLLLPNGQIARSPLLEVSSQTVVSCIQLNEFTVTHVKNIASVVAMIPHKPTLPSEVTEDWFFMLEKPGLDISTLGVRDDKNKEDQEDIGDVDVE
ncbi:hypothetical protein CY34DRAFT_26510 [Suillus luteus UH-Slu-Lm8-n1]|uniref:Uncharacterized protein n=1 Tax=Suillus luteus UH-Slu-Lm8-n1 TaxID=930992 RepID=A0A0D0ACL6_9AGAM|nr:hypothetical protein CY34DRAFT_26510 [Suillus luteus UH-Slu-Lm8-n1]